LATSTLPSARLSSNSTGTVLPALDVFTSADSSCLNFVADKRPGGHSAFKWMNADRPPAVVAHAPRAVAVA
jgi:hypothetical protein